MLQFADIVLFSWPLVVFVLFMRLSFQEALVWSIVAGYLLLPNIIGFDLPLVPPFDKELVINLSAAVMCVGLALAATRKQVPTRLEPIPNQAISQAPAENRVFIVQRGNLIFWTLIIVMLGATLLTAMNNSGSVFVGTRSLRGLKLYDALTISMDLLISITPFLLARRFLSSPEAHVTILKVFVLAMLAYSLLALWELRMSPQLNKQIYGFNPHIWKQNVRGGSYRPIVFLNHGLWLAILFAMAAMSAMALWREKLKMSQSGRWLLAAIYLVIIVYMSNSLGALIITVLLLPLVFLLGVRLQLFCAAIIAGTILLYPMLRGAGMIPIDFIYSATAQIDEKRADSLLFRFDNEDELLTHANKKPLAGWGTWGRNRVYNDSGRSTTTTDGYWIIVVGVYGWLGYIAQFGLLGLSTILLAMNRKRFRLTAATSGMALVVAAALVDLIPNATISPILWLFSGALMGRYQTAVAIAKEPNIRKAASMNREKTQDAARPVAAKEAQRDIVNAPLHRRRPREG